VKPFAENRPYIENEFQYAKWDETTGYSPEVLFEKLQEMQNERTDMPRPILCANAYAYLLDHVQLSINEHTPFAVKINIGVNYTSFASWDIYDKALFQQQRVKVLSEVFPEEYARMRLRESVGMGTIWADYWHTVPNWPFLLEKGFAGILEQARECRQALLDQGKYDEKQIIFLDSVILRYQAILRLLKRMYEYSLSFDVPEFSACIQHLAEHPPRTLYEVMQFSILFLYFEEIGCERGRTLGSIDRLYLPYMDADRANGMSLEEIRELFRYFFIHFTASKRYAEQPLTICGGDRKGNDYSNALSRLILDTYDELNIYDPKIHIRYHQNLDSEIFKKAMTMIRGGHNSICLINDEAVFQGYEKLGISREEAQEYVVLGCYEPVIIGKEEAQIGVTWFNTAKCIEFALNGGRDLQLGAQIGYESPMAIQSFEEFFDIYLKHLDDCLDFAIEFGQMQDEYAQEVNPTPIYSSTFPQCLKNGRDVHEGALKYNNISVKCFALATSTDSLAMIKKYVFDRGEISLDELRRALVQNWEGYEELRNKLLKDKEKYGNNLAMPDDIMTGITRHLEEKYCGLKLRNGGRLRLALDSVNSCINQGRHTAATPDGRYAGTPVSKNLCPTPAMDRNGITGYMQSVLKINAAAFLNSAIFDFLLHPSAVEGDKGLEDFQSLIRIFFAQGGFAAQGNIINGETLRDAREHPEKYATLQVRVCGWNEYFVKMSKEKQDLFIHQCEEG